MLYKGKMGEPVAMYMVKGTNSEGVKLTVTCTYNPKQPATDATVRSSTHSRRARRCQNCARLGPVP